MEMQRENNLKIEPTNTKRESLFSSLLSSLSFLSKKGRNVRPYIPAAKFPKREHVELLTTNV